MKLFFLLFIFLFSQFTFASGCHSTYLDGTRTGYGTVPLYSSIFLGTSSLLLATEGESGGSRDKKKAATVGGVVSVFSLYVSALGHCRIVDKEKYLKLKNQREKLLESGVSEKDLPFELKFLAPIPSPEEYKTMIEDWKLKQKKLLFMVGILDSVLLLENAQASTRDGVKIYSYGAVASIIALAIFDFDNLWNEKNPSWVRFDILSTRVNNNFVPVANLSFEY